MVFSVLVDFFFEGFCHSVIEFFELLILLQGKVSAPLFQENRAEIEPGGCIVGPQ